MQLTLAVRYLWGCKTRTFLTTLAVVFGVMVIFGLNGLLPTMMTAFRQNMLAAAGKVDLTVTSVTSGSLETGVPCRALKRFTCRCRLCRLCSTCRVRSTQSRRSSHPAWTMPALRPTSARAWVRRSGRDGLWHTGRGAVGLRADRSGERGRVCAALLLPVPGRAAGHCGGPAVRRRGSAAARAPGRQGRHRAGAAVRVAHSPRQVAFETHDTGFKGAPGSLCRVCCSGLSRRAQVGGAADSDCHSGWRRVLPSSLPGWAERHRLPLAPDSWASAVP